MDLDIGAGNPVLSRLGFTLGIDQMSHCQSKCCAVREQLIDVGIWKAVWLLNLVLRVKHRLRPSTDIPDEIRFHQDCLLGVEMPAVLQSDSTSMYREGLT